MMKKKMNKEIAKEITHGEYIKMLNTVHDCPKWSYKIQGIIGGCFAYHDKAEIPKYFLQEMREAAETEGTQKHIDVLNEVFGEEKLIPKFKVGEWVRIKKEWWILNVGDVYKITSISIPDDRSKNRPYRYYFKDGEFSTVDESQIEPWIPKIGEWVVADGKEGALKVTCVATDEYNPTNHSLYYVDAKNENTRYCIKNYPVKYSRPATKEEIAEAKGEGEMFFTKKGLEELVEVIRCSTSMSSGLWNKVPGEWSRDKVKWVNKVLTKALKDERR